MDPCTEACTKATTGTCALCAAREEANRCVQRWLRGGIAVEGWRLLHRWTGGAVFQRHRLGMAWLVGMGCVWGLAWFLPQAPGRETAVVQFVESHGLFLVVLLGSLILWGLWLLLWKLPRREMAHVYPLKDRIDLETKARQTLAQIVGGAVLLMGLYFTAQTLRTSQEALQVNQKALQTTQEGQITDRFTKAITQLGDTNLPIRLGGIYALERIAKDSAADHGAVMEVLTAFVREYSHRRPVSTQAQVPEDRAEGKPSVAVKPSTDIQAILTVIGRRSRIWEKGEIQRLNLAKTHLQGANLEAAHLEGANLEAAHLEGANLRAAHLERAFLWEPHLEGANLEAAHLEGAILWAAHLERANLQEAHLGGANLWTAHLEGANLWAAHLEGANLQAAHLEGANLQAAHLGGAILWQAHLEGADLRAAKNLTQDQLNHACMDEHTQLPPSLTKPPPCP